MEVDQGTSSGKETCSQENQGNSTSNKLKYTASGLKKTLHGVIYQLKLLMLFFKRGLDKSYSFWLATEMDAAEKFDDLVFHYKNKKKNGIVHCFLQAKHKQDESKKITAGNLVRDGDFSLQKYFISYRKIKQNFNGELKDFIIFTNIDLDDNLQKSFKIVEDNILNIEVSNKKKKHKHLKFNSLSDDLKKKLTSTFQEASDLNKLARMLAKCVYDNNEISLKEPLFKKYHQALAEKVIDIETKKFKNKFIDVSNNSNLSEDVKKFRKVLLEKSKLTEDEFKEALQTKYLNISKDFKNVFKLENNVEIIETSDIEKLAKKIVDLIPKENTEIVRIEKKASIIKNNIAKLAGHVFIKTEDNQIEFRQGFLNGDELPLNLDNFRTKLINLSTNKGIQFSQYQFQINIQTCTEEDYEEYKKDKSYFEKKFCCLPNDEVSMDEINEFLDKLVFAVNQPNENELGEIIEKEIGEEFNNINKRNVYLRFLEWMLNWMKEKKGRFISHEDGNNFFKSVKEEILGRIWFDVMDPVEFFTGRSKELEKLHNALQGGERQVVVETVISGLGGIGKSQLAKKYAQKYKKEYIDSNVIWINAENYKTMVTSFLNLARNYKVGISTKDKNGKEKSIKEIVAEIYEFFEERKSLFIFDNAEKYKTEKENMTDNGIDKFLPLSSGVNKPNFIITSRNQIWENSVKVIILLGIFTETESIDFIKKSLNITNNLQDEKIKELSKILQHFPLALQQAVAYIKEKDMGFKCVGSKFDINAYLNRFDEETEKLLDYKFPDDSTDPYTKTTFITWKISTNKIKVNNKYGKQAGEILDIIAYFAPDSIPVRMFLESELIDNDQEKLGNAVQLLKQYSMVSSEKEDQTVLNVHRLVQQVIRINLKAENRAEETLRKALRLADKNIENVGHAITVWRHAREYNELKQDFSNMPWQIIVTVFKNTLKIKKLTIGVIVIINLGLTLLELFDSKLYDALFNLIYELHTANTYPNFLNSEN